MTGSNVVRQWLFVVVPWMKNYLFFAAFLAAFFLPPPFFAAFFLVAIAYLLLFGLKVMTTRYCMSVILVD